MDIKEYIKNVRDCKERDIIYLIEKISEGKGFFKTNNKLYFMELNEHENKGTGVSTEKLEMYLDVQINSIDDEPQFPSGKYNIIWFKELEQRDEVECFISLCKTYSKNFEDMDIEDFFTAMISIFSIQRETSYKNLLGLYGEVVFLYEMLRKKGKNVTQCWHNSSYDKYDVVTNENNYEIKSSCKDDDYVHIKHDQLFNEQVQRNRLIFVKLEENNAGKSLLEIIEMLRKLLLKSNIELELKIEQELRKVSRYDAKNKKFKCKKLLEYKAKDIMIFNDIPKGIKKLQYDIDLNMFNAFETYI